MAEMQKTEELYYIDVRRTEFTARVLSCTEDEKRKCYRVILDRSAFFPEQGGQNSDQGMLGGAKVLEVHIRDGIITHFVSAPLPEGEEIEGQVDWARRFEFMQQHSGEHMLSGLVHARFGYDNVGFHLGETETQLDFSGPITQSELQELEEQVNAALWQNLPVRVYYPDAEELQKLDYRSKLELTENVRLVEIPGVDLCACCAPHVERTAEIGIVKIVDCINYKGGVRIHIACGIRALRDYAQKQTAVEAISRCLSVKRGEVSEAVRDLRQKLGETEAVCAGLGRQLLECRANELPAAGERRHALLFTEQADPGAMRNIVNARAEQYAGVVAVFSGADTSGWSFVLGSGAVDCAELAKLLRTKGFKCGGTKSYLQGSAPLTEQEIRTLFHEL